LWWGGRGKGGGKGRDQVARDDPLLPIGELWKRNLHNILREQVTKKIYERTCSERIAYTEKMTLLPQQNVFIMKPQQIRIIVETMSLATVTTTVIWS